LLWVLDTIHVIFMCHSVYSYTIVEYGNPIATQDGNWSLIASMVMNVVMIILVQSSFTYRVFKLCRRSRRWWVGGYIACLVACHLGFGITTCVFFFIYRRFTSLQSLRHVVVPFAVFYVASDLSISASLSILLYNHRSGFEDTNLVINRLIVFLTNRCMLTCTVAITESIVFMAFPHTLYFFALDFIVGKLYVNSLMAVLNSRAHRPRKVQDSDSSLDAVKISTVLACPRIPDDHLSFQLGETSSFAKLKDERGTNEGDCQTFKSPWRTV